MSPVPGHAATAASSVEISPQVADHLNELARTASGVPPSEFVPFRAGEYLVLGWRTAESPRADHIQGLHQLRVAIDGSVTIDLAAPPRLLLASPDDAARTTGVTFFIPKDEIPSDILRRAHSVTLLQGDVTLGDPIDWYAHSTGSSAVVDQIEDAHGGLVAEVRGDLASVGSGGEVVFMTDTAFGRPIAVSVVEHDGAAMSVDIRIIGRYDIGAAHVLLQWAAPIVPARGRALVYDIRFQAPGRGLAAALTAGHTRATAFRVATVLPGAS